VKSGIRIGQQFEFEVTVTEEMQAQFNGATVHPLYSSAAMVTHMEWASRQHILPFLEAGEEGVGYHINLDHLGAAPIGATVRIVSRMTGLKPGRVICRCEAFHQDRKIGQASFVQAILPLAKLHDRIPKDD
jgi:fluoroacetyl-CoA thioesterase